MVSVWFWSCTVSGRPPGLYVADRERVVAERVLDGGQHAARVGVGRLGGDVGARELQRSRAGPCWCRSWSRCGVWPLVEYGTDRWLVVSASTRVSSVPLPLA